MSRYYKPIAVQSHCQRCDRLMCYFKITSPRKYCKRCVEIERVEAAEFYRLRAKMNRRAAA